MISELYHYTNAAALIHIVQNRELWATQSNYLNDPTEITFGARALALRLAETPAPSGRPEDLLIRAGVLLEEQYFDAHSADLVVEERSFVTSFSRSDESLTLWRLYAGRNGFAIGFDQDILLAWLNNSNFFPLDGASEEDEAIKSNYQLFGSVEDVIYGETDLEHLVREIQSLNADELKRDQLDTELRSVFQKLSYRKHDAFADEREARLVIRIVGHHALDARVRVSGTGSLVSYRTFNFPREAIRSITMAPSANASQQRRALESLLSDGDRGSYSHVEIRESALPFNW
ncbi:hypothetical protein JOE38_001349 [Clavibacter michiganensis]|uniref:DUF2971 domain-containing protein n=1 Tax=Clavibacter michiganensis TaxID=28447 RepID=UPI001959A46B|nr:DUF2971 domain-containing protein [Clavibacter michiganensis]MBM7411526.1 hypothetical protein [Clavibacter michiganensis]